MSWHFSRALVGEYLVGSYSGGELSAPSSGILTPLLYCAPDRMTAFSRLSQYGTISAHLRELPGADEWMLSRAGSLAPTSVAPGRGRGSTDTRAACGLRWHGSSVRYDLRSRSWKTAHSLYSEDLPESSVILPKWGWMLDGGLSEPNTCPVKRHTKETGYGSLPTPSGTTGAGNHVVGRLDEWGGSSNPFRGTSLASLRLPGLEEWMLGWPESWTELTPLGTDKFHAWLRLHGKF